MGGFSESDQSTFNQALTTTDSSSQQAAQQQAQNAAFNQAQSATQLSPDQLPFFQQLWGAGSQQLGAGGGILDPAQAAYRQAVTGGVNPGVAEVIANASREMGLDFQRNVLPGIRRGAVSTGSLGGARQGIAEGLAAGEVARAQGGMTTDMYMRALDQARAERMGALGMSGMMQALPWTGINQFANAVGTPIMQSFASSMGQAAGTSSGVSSGSSLGRTVGTQVGGGSGDASSFNILGKK